MTDHTSTHTETTQTEFIDANDNNTLPKLDNDGHLQDYREWSITVAQQLADTLELTLTARHIEILQAVRRFYSRYEHAPNTRPLIKYLQQELADMTMTNQYLQAEFNTGLVARHLSRLAGLPKPTNCL